MAVLFTSGKKEFRRSEKKVFLLAVKFGKDSEILNIYNAT
jgi:hypothetical protein